jgi:hypothetical protein
MVPLSDTFSTPGYLPSFPYPNCKFAILGERLNDDGGKTNPLCGEPKNMDNIPKHTFRCELYGKFVTVKKANPPVQYGLVLLEVMVNKEPTRKFRLQTCHYSVLANIVKISRLFARIF